MSNLHSMSVNIYRVIVDDCRYRDHKGDLCVEWVFRILDDERSGETLTKYNNLNGPAAGAFFLEELRLLNVPCNTEADFNSAPSRLIGKECYVRYGVNEFGYTQTEINFEKTAEIHLNEKISETWKRYFTAKNNGKE